MSEHIRRGRGRPRRTDVYRRLDAQVADLRERMGGLPAPEDAAGIWRDIWYEEAHHSTAIEGNTLVLKQVAELLREGRAVGNKELREYLEVQGRMRTPEIQSLPEHLRELGPSYRGADPEGTARWMEIEHASRPYGRLPAQPLREPITYARLATMRVPTLVLSGQADILAPPLLMRMLAAQIPASSFASLEDVGHAGFWERPEVWNGLVLEFIGRH